MSKLKETIIFLNKIENEKIAIINQYSSFIQNYKEELIKIYNDYYNFISSEMFDEYLVNRKFIKENYLEQWDENFNIFKIISETYYYEKLHSRIIGSIFDKKTPDINDGIYLKHFLQLLIKENEKIQFHDFGENYVVKLEEPIDIGDKGNIDILIYDDTHAIIIENKIYNAPDTSNQLAKYFKHVTTKMNKTVTAVVYLPLDPNKKPPFNEYFDGYENYVRDIKKVLAIIPVISNNRTNDFVHGFINEIVNYTKDKKEKLAFLFFEQYIKLLKYLGGKYMGDVDDKKLFAKLYEDEKSIEIANSIFKILEKKELFTKLLFRDAFIKELESMGFENYKDYDQKREHCWMRLNILDDIDLSFYQCEGDDPFFGFYSVKKITGSTKKILEVLLNENDYKERFYEEDWGVNWVGRYIKIMDLGDKPICKTIEFFTKLLKEIYLSLKEKVIKRLKDIKE